MLDYIMKDNLKRLAARIIKDVNKRSSEKYYPENIVKIYGYSDYCLSELVHTKITPNGKYICTLPYRAIWKNFINSSTLENDNDDVIFEKLLLDDYNNVCYNLLSYYITKYWYIKYKGIYTMYAITLDIEFFNEFIK